MLQKLGHCDKINIGKRGGFFNMKKFKLLSIVFALALVFTACGSSSDSDKDDKGATTSEYEDGVYYVSGETAKNGWKSYLTFEVKDGKVMNVDYDAYNMRDGDARVKSVRGEAGDYNLPEDSVAPIQDQFAVVEGLIESGEITSIEFDEEGRSDANSGATIKYAEAKDLFEAALSAGPVAEAGSMEDGYYFGQAEADDKGNTAQVVYIVFNGNIVAAEFDAVVPGDEGDSYKSVLSIDGEYNLADGAVAPMHEQLATLNAELVANQVFEYELDEDGKVTDASSGATISIDGYEVAFNNAVKK